MDECFYWNLYIPLDSIGQRNEREFYEKLYDYKNIVIRKFKERDRIFFESKKYIDMQNDLNKAYEIITDLSSVKKKANGEYDYPLVDFKIISTEKNKKKIDTIYICIVSPKEELIKKISAGKFFALVPLYTSGKIFVKEVNKEEIEKVYIESDIHGIINSFKKYHSVICDAVHAEACTDIVSWIDKYPSNTISVINFNYVFSEKDINLCVDEFLSSSEDLIAN